MRSKKILALLLTAFLCALSSCANSPEPALLEDVPLPRELPTLADDGPDWSKEVSELTIISGAQFYSSSGEPGAKISSKSSEWLELNGADGEGLAWAIWQFPVSADTVVQKVEIKLQQSGLNRFHFAVANYAAGRWSFPHYSANPDGQRGQASLELGEDDGSLHSPGQFVYVAALVLPGSIVHVSSAELTVEDTGGGNDDPIFDQYEDNDRLEDAFPLLPGMHRASIHESVVLEMEDQNEIIDSMDFYTVPVQAGQTLTCSLRFEVANRFPEVGEPLINDLDLLLYPPGATLELDQFNEDASGLEIYFYPFEHGSWTVSSGGEYMIGVIAREEGKDNAEYDLMISVSDTAFDVGGVVTQNGGQVTERFVAFLEPGNYNCVTTLDPEFPADAGRFNIEGVPPGVYSLRVHSSASFHEAHPYTWPEQELVIVSNQNMDVGIDIGSEP